MTTQDELVAMVVALGGDLGVDVVDRALGHLDHHGALAAALDRGVVFVDGGDIQASTPPPAVAPGQAREIHAALAEALPPGDALPLRERRARHLGAAVLLPDERVAEEIASVARDLRLADRIEAAAERFVDAARLTPDLEPRAARLRAAGEALWLLSRFDDAAPLLEEAYAISSDPVRRADVGIILGQIELWSRGGAHALAVLVPAAETVAAVDPDRAAALLVHASHTVIVSLDAAAGIRFARRSMELATAGTGALVPAAQVALLMAHVHLGEVEPADEHWTGLSELAWGLIDAEGVPELEHLLNALGLVATVTERWDAGEAYLERVVFRARAAGSPSMLAMAAGCLAELRFRSGRVDEALKLLHEEVADGSDRTGEIPRAWLQGIIARVDAVVAVDLDRVRATAASVIATGERLGAPIVELWGRHALSLVDLLQGDPAAAARHLDRVSAATAAGLVREPGLAWWQPDHVEALWRAGRRHEAGAALQRLHREASATGRKSALAGAARCEALVAADETVSEAAAQRALDGFASLPAPFEVGRTLLVRAELRASRGELDAARFDLEGARATFHGLGARAWCARTEAALADLADDPLDVLTDAERRVVARVVTGERNRDVAAALHLSPRTVETHLEHAYRKLGVRSRTQLAALVAGRLD